MEVASDASFLERLFVACSPLRGLLPDAILHDQAAAKAISYKSEYPGAIGHLVSKGERPIGRIMIDWSRPATSRCVDIAILPEHQSLGIGTALLRAWIDMSDSRNQQCELSVLRDNPAARLYARLGFTPHADDDGCFPLVEMGRQPGDGGS